MKPIKHIFPIECLKGTRKDKIHSILQSSRRNKKAWQELGKVHPSQARKDSFAVLTSQEKRMESDIFDTMVARCLERAVEEVFQGILFS